MEGVKTRIWPWLVAVLIAAGLVVVLTWGAGWPQLGIERLLGESPQARLEAYLAAVERGDRAGAMACWEPGAPYPETAARREQVTGDLLGLARPLHHRVVSVEWWADWCCEGSVVQDPNVASKALMRVEVTPAGGPPRLYQVTVRARVLLGSAEPGNSAPVRHWVLFDAQPVKARYSAIYLVKGAGRLSPEDLQAHPDVLVTHTFAEFKQQAQVSVALWIDQDAVDLVDENWLHQSPQKYWPVALVGCDNALYSFRELLSGYVIGPYVDWSQVTLQPGYSVWMIEQESSSGQQAFLQGYTRPPTVHDIQSVTDWLLQGEPAR